MCSKINEVKDSAFGTLIYMCIGKGLVKRQIPIQMLGGRVVLRSYISNKSPDDTEVAVLQTRQFLVVRV